MGRYEVRADAEQRWHVRLHCDDQVDVWLISWTAGQGTPLHDHGGSGGAFTVVSGALNEAVWSSRDGGLRDTTRHAGETVAFGDDYIRDVRNLHAQTAVSVHAYSPPLSSMNYYDTEARPGQEWIVVCTEGYTSSLAAASLKSLGLRATDIVGGIHAWRDEGLPVAGSLTTVESVVSPHAPALGVS